MAPPIYQTPNAISQVLGTNQSPEIAELLNRKMMMEQGVPAARPIPAPALLPVGGAGTDFERAQKFEREAEGLLPEGAGLPWNLGTDAWLMRFHDQPVPWHPEITFGEWLLKVREKHGEKAEQLAIEKFQELQKENSEAKEPSVEPPIPTPPPPMPVPQPQGQQVQQLPPQAPQQVMSANEGGFVHRGTIAGELAPRGIMSVREAGETLRELRKRRDEERRSQGYADGGLIPGYQMGGYHSSANTHPGVAQGYPGGTSFHPGIAQTQKKIDDYRAAQEEEDYFYEPPKGVIGDVSGPGIGDVSGPGIGDVSGEGLKNFIPSYAEGGMNTPEGIPEEAQVSEQDFMNILTQKANEAGIPNAAMQTIAQNIPEAAADFQGQVANDNAMDSGSGIMEMVQAEEAGPETDSGIAQLPAISEQLVARGEEPLVQATPGEIIFDPRLLNAKQQRMLFASLEAAGIDPNTITVGGEMPINELTGLPAAGIGSFIKKTFKKVKKVVKKVGKFLKKNASTILGIAGALTGNPWLAALGSGIGKLIEGEGVRAALVSAGMSFVATKWVGPWIGRQIGSATSWLSETFPETMQGIGSFFAPGGTGAALEGLSSGLPEGVGSSIATSTGAGQVGHQAAQAGWNAAVQSAGLGAAPEVVQQAAQNAMLSVAAPSLVAPGMQVGQGIAEAAIAEALPVTAGTIANSAISSVASGVPTAALIAQGPGQVLMAQAGGSGISNILAQPLQTTLGGIAGGAINQYAEPMVQQMVSDYYDYPEGDEDAARQAFEEQYNYTPTADELYTFYTTSYVPTQPTVAETISDIPGFIDVGAQQQQTANVTGIPTITAAGGGYIDGVGGPKTDSNLARLSDGEFVMTEKSVRGAGNGDRMRGAAEMYRMMDGLERRVA